MVQATAQARVEPQVLALSLREGGEKGKIVQIKRALKNGRYTIEDIFAYGGMGVIFRARDSKIFHNEVLIKAIKYQASEFAFDRQKALYNIYQMRQMFKRERRIICELRNRGINNIPSVNDFFYDHNPQFSSKTYPFGKLHAEEHHAFLKIKMQVYREPYLVMERIYGKSFLECLKECAPLSICKIVRDVLLILSKMHLQQKREDGSTLAMIYLDLKPENILVDDFERTTLIDFGGTMPIVNGKKRKEGRGALTHGYAAPELTSLLSSADRVDGRADVYSAGAVLWRAFTGKDPARLADPLTNPFPILSPDELPSSVKGPLKDLIAKAIARDVDRRWPSAQEMMVALNRLIDDS
jgi:serine/threonine protein kinase